MKIILSFSIFSILLFSVFLTQGQTKHDQINVQFNSYRFQPGDTLSINAGYSSRTGTMQLATLELVIENTNGNRTRLRWPLINGKVSGEIVLPPTLPADKYTVYMAVEPRFFELLGKLNNSKPQGSLNAMLLTSKGEWDSQEISVRPDGQFLVNNWLFQNDGIIAFSDAKHSGNNLDIRISTVLDSVYEPIALAARQIYVGNNIIGITTKIDSLGSRLLPDASRFSGGEMLPAVVVKAKTKSRAEQFDEAYASGLFKGGDSRIFSLMDDPNAIAYQSVLAYLQGRVAGLQINNAGFGGGTAIWRGNQVSFFVDEVRADASRLQSISMADIAIVKVFPPPFFGAPGGGSGGAIAVYTRRGGEANFLPANRSVFKIKGYTPLTITLDMNKLAL